MSDGTGLRAPIATASPASSNAAQPFVIAFFVLGLLFVLVAALPAGAIGQRAYFMLLHSRTTVAVTGVSLLSATALLLAIAWGGQ